MSTCEWLVRKVHRPPTGSARTIDEEAADDAGSGEEADWVFFRDGEFLAERRDPAEPFRSSDRTCRRAVCFILRLAPPLFDCKSAV